jgi:carbamoyl-phosphate synthase small subunit
MSAALILEDGEVFAGRSVGADGVAFGEAVFATAMTGYQELVTDPSYAEQILCFTAPMVGNYGVAEDRVESERIHVRGVVMREARGPEWTSWLRTNGVVALTGVDTRSLVLHLRERGSQRAAIATREVDVGEIEGQPPMSGRSLAAGVSTRDPYRFCNGGGPDVAVVDYGCKRSILRRLERAGAAVTVYPHDAEADTLAAHEAVLLSNGPGDPEPLHEEIATLCCLVGRVPVFGICLGHQLVALATGHETFKLPFGHRGANHPVVDRRSGRVLVTSQNHGFAVRPSEGREATHVSLYDGTVEGLDYPELRARSVQFHPEAGPGPHDAWPLLETWVEDLRAAA